MKIGVSNTNVPIFPQRVCTLVLFVNTCVWLLEVREVTVTLVTSLTLGMHARMHGEGYSSCLMCLYVCMYVCLSEHAILAVRAVRSITKDAIVLSVRFAAILKRRFS